MKQDPEQEQQVRRLLADARHDEPVPEEVVARLDRVLADLANEPARSATVVRLADRRRRAGRMLVAAAAVVVAGIGVGQVVGGGDEGENASSGADSSVTAEDAPPESLTAPDAGGAAEDFESTRTRPYRLDAQKFSRDASALQALGGDGFLTGEQAEPQDGAQGSGGSRAELSRAPQQDVCEPGDWGRGGFFPVVYEDSPGWMVLRPPQGETQVADLFLCGSEQAVRSVTLPLR